MCLYTSHRLNKNNEKISSNYLPIITSHSELQT